MGREKMNNLALCLLILGCVQVSAARTNNVCSVEVMSYIERRICAYLTWQACSEFKTVSVPVTSSRTFCCSGWSGPVSEGCNTPECLPACQNGGTCVAPGQCQCRDQNTGPRCAGSQCSHVTPCYPGTCQPGTTNCQCWDDFTSAGSSNSQRCLKIQKAPQIFQMRAKLSYWKKMNGNTSMQMYALWTDSTNRDNMDFIWTNRKTINKLEVTAASQFSASNLPPRPSYVSDSEFGIVSGSLRVLHSKLAFRRRRRSTRPAEKYLSLDKPYNCDNTTSALNPYTSVLNCSINTRFDRSLESGDNLTITFRTESGGFRQLKDTNTGQNYGRAQIFVGQTNESSVQFRFDLDPPFHCHETLSCGGNEMLLDIEDITKGPLEIGWSGWQDSLSGMFRYTVEVFALSKSNNNTLRILSPLKPLFITQVNETGGRLSQDYLPSSPGMYAVILEAADLANNTKYVRRLALYDPVSNVTTDPSNHLRFTTANPRAGYAFQNDINGPIVVSWEGFFVNALHEEKGLLGAVEAYPPQLEDFRKTIHPKLDDHEGERTVNAIPNERGIVKFEIAVHRESSAVGQNRLINPPPNSPWREVGLNQTYTIPPSVNEGDTVIVWVRASDIMGNQLVRRAMVTFDPSPPQVGQLEFRMNDRVPGIEFSSTFLLTAQDDESGIAHVNWKFTRSNGTQIYKRTVPARTVQNCIGRGSECYCNRLNQCFWTDQSFSLSNCHMMVEKERLDTEIISVTAEIVNKAGLMVSRTMLKGRLTDLNGINEYYPPQNVRLESLSERSAELTWVFSPSCFERQQIFVDYTNENGENRNETVHADTKRYELVDLKPGTQYFVILTIIYADNTRSNPQTFVFTTATVEASGLTVGQKVGIGIGAAVVVVVLVVVLVVLLLRRRQASQASPAVAWQKKMNAAETD